MRSRRSAILLLVVGLLAFLPQTGKSQTSWLDGNGVAWNTPGMAIPAAGEVAARESTPCQSLVRPAETAEDAAITARGWRLYAGYQRGWGITLIGGFVDFDAMCRPVPYQQFVFVDGVFAGTLAPAPMLPRSDGALTEAGISAANSLFAVYNRYAATDPLCCPSDETLLTFTIERTDAGPAVLPNLAMPSSSAGATPIGEATIAVCVGRGGDALTLEHWTAGQLDAEEARATPVVRAHPVTGGCVDPAGLPLLPDASASFSWVCSRTFAGLWYGPVWTANIYRAASDVPPNPANGGCPEPRDETMPQKPESELAAATAVYISQLEAGDLTTLFAWLHPDAQAVIPEPVVVGWYASEWLPLGPDSIVVNSVEIAPWTWDVTGTTYPHAAEIAYQQAFADGTVAGGVTHLVQDDNGVWRWFFGADAAFVAAQIARFAPQGTDG